MGMLLADLIMDGAVLDNNFSYLTDIENSGNHQPAFIQKIKDYDMDEKLKEFITDCLQLAPENRPSLTDLLHSPFLENVQATNTIQSQWPIMAHSFDNSLKASDIFYLFQVGRDVQKVSQIHSINLPWIVRLVDDLDLVLNEFSKCVSLPISVEEVELNVSDLLEESTEGLSELKLWNRIGDWEFKEIDDSIKLFCKRQDATLEWERKEADLPFQKMRVKLFRDLLIRYPRSSDKILLESAGSFPSHLRASVYCALLGVEGDTWIIFDVLNCDISTSMDQQV